MNLKNSIFPRLADADLAHEQSSLTFYALERLGVERSKNLHYEISHKGLKQNGSHHV
jgi:hypothetical protein